MGGMGGMGGTGGVAAAGMGGMTSGGGMAGGALTSGGAGGAGARKPPTVTYGASAWGDPHLTTFDGLKYDIQAVGELTELRDASDELEVQVRTRPYGSSQVVAVAVGVAARVGRDRVAFYVDKPSTLNGVETDFATTGTNLPDGGIVFANGGTHVVVWPDGSQLQADTGGAYYELLFHVSPSRAGRLEGLLGGNDGSRTDELLTRDGKVLPSPASFETFYGVFAESWRITQQHSLFDYGPGENTETYTNRSFPRWLFRSQDLGPDVASHAALVCAGGGVTDPYLLDSCVLDVGATGDDSFADGYGNLPTPGASLEILPPRITGGSNGGGLGYPAARLGSLEPGGENFYSFSANKGDAILIRAVDEAGGPFTPYLRVYDSAGTLVSADYRGDVAYASFNAATSGTFTAVVSDRSTASGRGGRLQALLRQGARRGRVPQARLRLRRERHDQQRRARFLHADRERRRRRFAALGRPRRQRLHAGPLHLRLDRHERVLGLPRGGRPMPRSTRPRAAPSPSSCRTTRAAPSPAVANTPCAMSKHPAPPSTRSLFLGPT